MFNGNLFVRKLPFVRFFYALLFGAVLTQFASADINVEKAPDFYLHHEVTIDRPAEQVWKYLIDMGSWIVTHKVEHHAGTPFKKGYVMKFTPKGYLSMEEKDRPARPHHFGKALRYVENENFLHTGYTYKEGSYGNFVFKDYVDFRLREKDGKTLVVLNGMGVIGGDVTQEEADQTGAVSSKAMKANLLYLKKLVESH